MRSDERQDLVELGRRRAVPRCPGSRIVDDAAVDEFDRPDVEAARRLRDEEQLEVVRELAGDDHLLLVAARQVRDRRVDARACGCRSAATSSCACASIARSCRTRRRANGAPVVGVQHEVVGDRERGRRRRACCGPRARARRRARCTWRGLRAGDVDAVDLDRARPRAAACRRWLRRARAGRCPRRRRSRRSRPPARRGRDRRPW